MDREDRILRHRRTLVGVARAEPLEIDRLAVLLHQHDSARDFAGGDLAVDERLDRRELFNDDVRTRRWAERCRSRQRRGQRGQCKQSDQGSSNASHWARTILHCSVPIQMTALTFPSIPVKRSKSYAYGLICFCCSAE